MITVNIVSIKMFWAGWRYCTYRICTVSSSADFELILNKVVLEDLFRLNIASKLSKI